MKGRYAELYKSEKDRFAPLFAKIAKDARYAAFTKPGPLGLDAFGAVEEMFGQAEVALDNDSQLAQALAGTEVRLGALDPVRDFTFVQDTVDGFLRVGWAPEAVGQEINIGGGECISIADLAAKILALVGRDLPVLGDRQRLRPAQSEVMLLHAGSGKARQLLGWQPQVGLDEGLRQTVEWIGQHLDRYRPGVYEV